MLLFLVLEICLHLVNCYSMCSFDICGVVSYCVSAFFFFFFFFKQKTAYEMRISDWSSDVCSSDLGRASQRSDGSADPARRHAECRPSTFAVPRGLACARPGAERHLSCLARGYIWPATRCHG